MKISFFPEGEEKEQRNKNLIIPHFMDRFIGDTGIVSVAKEKTDKWRNFISIQFTIRYTKEKRLKRHIFKEGFDYMHPLKIEWRSRRGAANVWAIKNLDSGKFMLHRCCCRYTHLLLLFLLHYLKLRPGKKRRDLSPKRSPRVFFFFSGIIRSSSSSHGHIKRLYKHVKAAKSVREMSI